MPEPYPWIKALHVAAVLTWVAGMIVAPTVIARGNGRGDLAALRRHFSRVTTPAMILALALGLWLAQDGVWFRAGWLQAKLALVFGLIGVHGLLFSQMRRIDAGVARGASPWVAHLSPVVILAVLAIAILVIVKPAPWRAPARREAAFCMTPWPIPPMWLAVGRSDFIVTDSRHELPRK